MAEPISLAMGGLDGFPSCYAVSSDNPDSAPAPSFRRSRGVGKVAAEKNHRGIVDPSTYLPCVYNRHVGAPLTGRALRVVLHVDRSVEPARDAAHRRVRPVVSYRQAVEKAQDYQETIQPPLLSESHERPSIAIFIHRFPRTSPRCDSLGSDRVRRRNGIP